MRLSHGMIDYPGFAGINVNSSDTVLYRTVTSSGGCDSVTRLEVNVILTKHVYDTVETTEQVYIYDGRTLTASGDYEHRTQSNAPPPRYCRTPYGNLLRRHPATPIILSTPKSFPACPTISRHRCARQK